MGNDWTWFQSKHYQRQNNRRVEFNLHCKHCVIMKLLKFRVYFFADISWPPQMPVMYIDTAVGLHLSKREQKRKNIPFLPFFETSGNSTGDSFSLPASHRVKALNKVNELNTRVRFAVRHISSLFCNFQFLICIRLLVEPN